MMPPSCTSSSKRNVLNLCLLKKSSFENVNKLFGKNKLMKFRSFILLIPGDKFTRTCNVLLNTAKC